MDYQRLDPKRRAREKQEARERSRGDPRNGFFSSIDFSGFRIVSIGGKLVGPHFSTSLTIQRSSVRSGFMI